MNATAIRSENASDAALSAVIIYERFDFAAKAKAMLERVAQRTDESTRWSIKPWRADMLDLPPAADAALAEAAEAQLVVLALQQVQFLPAGVGYWLERWATSRQVKEAALAVWHGGNAPARSARVAPGLSQLAGRLGLSLILGDALVEDKSSAFASALHEREGSSASTLQHSLGFRLRDPYQHWGINE